MRDLEILQWNARRLEINLPEFQTFLSSLSAGELPNIICMQETWLSEETRIKISGYSVYHSTCQGRGGECHICKISDIFLYRKHAEGSRISDYPRLGFNNKIITVHNVYRLV